MFPSPPPVPLGPHGAVAVWLRGGPPDGPAQAGHNTETDGTRHGTSVCQGNWFSVTIGPVPKATQ